MDARDPRRRIADNPFYVLGLPPECSLLEVEREGRKLLGMLELGLSDARSYRTPLGPRERTSEKVREAMAELREPERRLSHEMWARLRPDAARSAPHPEREPPGGWPDALARLGWRRP